ncbi:MAG: CopG family transcriptional regulator [Syntrophus sp. (in: bacteria)]|nr:CopG family transcriptional regulator [Syntrophus sp. (in: bacteria)]
MAKVVTLRLDDEVYHTFKTLADQENRPLSNFIETAALRYINEIEFVDEFETAEINSNTALKDSIKKGIEDYKNLNGRFI